MSVINPRVALLKIASEQLGIRETSKNQGAGIAKFWEATWYPDGYKNREPYCAAFVCWVVAEAMRRGYALGLTEATRPKSPAVKDWIPWAQKASSGALVFGVGDRDHKPDDGDIVVFTFSHIGIVAGPLSNGYFPTVEANTNGAGSREGDGIYAKSRASSLARAFIRLAWRAKKA